MDDDPKFQALARRACISPRNVAEFVSYAIEMRREAEALSLVDRCFPNDPDVTHLIGLLHRNVGDLDLAIAAFDRALDMTPTAKILLIHARARAALEAGHESVSWYRRAHDLAPQDADILLGLAAALAADRQADRADSLLSSVLREHPGWITGHNTLIRLRFMCGHAGDSLDEINRAIKNAPRDYRLHEVKIRALYRIGNPLGTLGALSSAIDALNGDDQIATIAACVRAELAAAPIADAAFSKLNPVANEELAIHFMRLMLRRGRPELVAALRQKLPEPLGWACLSYSILAWRLLNDQRATFWEDARFLKVIDLPHNGYDRRNLESVLDGLHLTQGQPLDQSVRGGTQTDGPLFSRTDDAVRSVRRLCEAEVKRYLNALRDDLPDHPFLIRAPKRPRFAGSWSVKLREGGYHDAHVHGEGWVSSALYVRLPDTSTSAGAGQLVLGHPPGGLALQLPEHQRVAPRPYRLVLFPSYWWHGTTPFAKGDRLSIAFDIH